MGSDRINASGSSPAVPSLDGVRPIMAKAVHRGPSSRLVWSAVVKDALIRHFGKLEAAAITMGNYDPSQLSRDLSTGKFKFERLELCDAEAQAFIAAALFEAFGYGDPKLRIQRLIREGRRILDELAEAVA
jgi:hypothetical protein